MIKRWFAKSDKGFWITLLLSIGILFIYYGNILLNINSTYLSGAGDGFGSYYTGLYHLKYDKSFWNSDAMNYPYGENIFFSISPPLFFVVLKAINNVVDIVPYTVGIFNFSIFFSICLSAGIIYLIFRKLQLPMVYSIFAALGIAFLSPQIVRLLGHYALTYQFGIPLVIYLLMLFDEKPTWKISIAISLVTFWFAGTHLYYFGFFSLIIIIYFLGKWILGKKPVSKIPVDIMHILLQLIIPYVLLQLIVNSTNSVHDRSDMPLGFFYYISNAYGVFFPLDSHYRKIAEWFVTPGFVQWEGESFAGLIGTITFVFILLRILKNILNKDYKKIFHPIDHPYLNYLMWAAIAALLLSFCFPFKQTWGRPLYDHVGFLRQLRSIGRFAWVFYYIINIVGFYLIYQWASRIKKKWLGYAVMTLAIAMVYIDAQPIIKDHQRLIFNQISTLNDEQNETEENKWVKQINVSDYQSIFGLPYSHVGSENIGHFGDGILHYVWYYSLKLGIPTINVHMSRTSIGQTFDNYAFLAEPYRKLKFVNDFKNDKKLLVLVNQERLDDLDRGILSKCTFLMKTPNFDVYELEYATMEHIADSLYADNLREYQSIKTYQFDDFYSTDSVKNFVYYNYDQPSISKTYKGTGAKEAPVSDYLRVFEGTIENKKEGVYTVSFWMGNMRTDVVPRGFCEFALFDKDGKVYSNDIVFLNSLIKVIDGEWTLLEKDINIHMPTDKLQITIWNPEIKKGTNIIDELLIRPKSTHVYKMLDKGIYKDNRWYYQDISIKSN